MSVAVTVENLAKRFGSFEALGDVSLRIAPGELVALLGPSGSGKTTLLRVIAGLEQACSGRVLFDETDATNLSLKDRRIGFVFQNYALFKHMKVAENIAFGLKARPRQSRPSSTEIKKRVSELLDLVQLSGLENRFPAQLSGGQRQRVALARALAIEPRVLLLDEPFGALDAKVRKELRRWLRQLHEKTGHTTLFVTHDQDEALELSDRVAILNGGRVEQIDTPDRIYDSPASAFVCEFLGEINRLSVTCRDGRIWFENVPFYPAKQTFSPQDRLCLFVRPQDIRESFSEPEAFQGRVTQIRRSGAIRRLTLSVGEHLLDMDWNEEKVPEPGEMLSLRITKASVFAV